jgi:hypothetical protein
MMTTAQVVSRALRRDVGIITQPFPKVGYSVHQDGGSGYPSIWVSVSDAEGTNVRAAKQLEEELREVYGWTVLRTGSIIYVGNVPSKAESAESLANWEKRQSK